MNAYTPVPSILDSAGVDPKRAGDILGEALAGADDGELFVERSESESFLFDDGRLKSAAFDAAEGFGLRVVAGETAGYAHASEISEAAIRRAGQSAALAKRGYAGVAAEGPRATNARLYGEDDPLASPDFSDKVALLEEIDAWARARDPRVVQVMASLAGERRTVEILRADGRLIRDVRPLARINVQITVEGDGKRESGYSGAGGRAGFEAWIAPDKWREQVDEALRQALVNLEAIPCPAGEMDVVLGPGWNGVLLHEAVGHGLEGDFNRKGTSAFSGRIGERVAAPGVTVFDDGAIHGRRGSLTVDDEGTPTGRTILIEDGILVGYMHDRMSARLMGLTATGNGPTPILRPPAHAADDQHRDDGRQPHPGRDDRRHPARALLRQLRRRPGGHHQRQVRLPVHRGLPDRGRQGHHAGEGRDPDRRWPLGAHAGDHDRRRLRLRRRGRRLRQGRPEPAGGRRPAVAEDRRPDGGRHQPLKPCHARAELGLPSRD